MNSLKKAVQKVKLWYGKQDRWQKAGVWAIVIIAVIAVTAMIYGIRHWPESRPPEPPAASSQTAGRTDVMPYVIGLSAEDAYEMVIPITDDVTLRRKNGAKVLFATGMTVAGQVPDAGTPVDRNSAIVLLCLSPEEIQNED